MKRKNNESKVGDVIDVFLHQYGLKKRYQEYKLLSSWEKIVGPMIAKGTDDIRIVNGILYAKINSASLRSELNFMKTSLVKRLNEEAGMELIQDVVFQ